MLAYIARRLLMVVPVLVGISVVVFLMVHLIPGDPVQVMLGERATDEEIARLRQELGLNDPIYVQYARFLGRVAHGDLGRSLRSNSRVVDEIAARFPVTIELAVASILIATVFGLLAGCVAAVHQHSLFDYFTMVLALVGVSMPVFWIGLMLVILFGRHLGWFPIAGVVADGIELARVTNFPLLDSLLSGNVAALRSVLSHLVLPSITLATIPVAIIARMTRSTMLNVLRQDYIRTAKAKGLAHRRVVYKHALKNALVPVVTVVGLQFGSLLGGAVLTETVFARPGIGRLVVTAIFARDYPMVQGVVLVGALTFVFTNLAVDVLYALLNPKIRYA